jgi:hypothetical protein
MEGILFAVIAAFAGFFSYFFYKRKQGPASEAGDKPTPPRPRPDDTTPPASEEDEPLFPPSDEEDEPLLPPSDEEDEPLLPPSDEEEPVTDEPVDNDTPAEEDKPQEGNGTDSPTEEEALPTPPLITRSDWGAQEADGPLSSLEGYEFIVIHHSATNFSETDGKKNVRKLQSMHIDGRGWVDIGYHFLVDASGNVYQGRAYFEDRPLADKPELAMGAHVGGQNSGKIGICLIGCFEAEESGCSRPDTISSTEMEKLAEFCAFLSKTYEIPVDNIKGHRDFKATACPGSNAYKQLGELRKKVKALLS